MTVAKQIFQMQIRRKMTVQTYRRLKHQLNELNQLLHVLEEDPDEEEIRFREDLRKRITRLQHKIYQVKQGLERYEVS
jgi:hypothetical protein